MKIGKIALLIAAAVPAVMACKKYHRNSEHYNEKARDIWNSLKDDTINGLKFTCEQKDKAHDIIKKHTNKAADEVQDVLKPQQKELHDKLKD